jgi:hypothetical protein
MKTSRRAAGIIRFISCRRFRRYALLLLVGLGVLASSLSAKKNHKKVQPEPEQDQIQVAAHIPIADGPGTRFFTTAHYSQYYLYIEHGAGQGVTLIDVTDPSKPHVIAEIGNAGQGSGALLAVTGTAVLTTDAPSSAPTAQPVQTIRIFNCSDPLHPKVVQEFRNVTNITQDERRGLFFLANDDGVWILRQHYATDPKVEKEYARHVLYDH